MSTTTNETWLTPKEAAKRARVSRTTIYLWCEERRLTHRRSGALGSRGRILIRQADLDALLKEMEVERHPFLANSG
jgi:excisionase family DNA binding protein